MRAVLAALVLCAWLTGCMIVGKAVAGEPWKPFHLVLNLGSVRMVSQSTFASRAECEQVLGQELLRLAVSPLTVRWGECRSVGWEI